MVYVAIALFVGFAAFFFVGMRAVSRSTQFVIDERLAIAETVAAQLSRESEHVLPDTEANFEHLTPGADSAALEDAVARALGHFATVDRFVFFDVISVWLLDASGRLIAEAPQGAYEAQAGGMLFSGPVAAPTILWPERSDGRLFFSAALPIKSATGEIWARAVVNTKGRDIRSDFVPTGTLAGQESQQVSPSSTYHLEVITTSGTAVVGIGPDEKVGEQNWPSPETFSRNSCSSPPLASPSPWSWHGSRHEGWSGRPSFLLQRRSAWPEASYSLPSG